MDPSYTADPFNCGITEQQELLPFVKFHCVNGADVIAGDNEKITPILTSITCDKGLKRSMLDFLLEMDNINQRENINSFRSNRCHSPGRYRVLATRPSSLIVGERNLRNNPFKLKSGRTV